jgi:hypothetical protein
MKNIFASCWFIQQEIQCSSTYDIWNSPLPEYSLSEQSCALELERNLMGYLTKAWINNI